MTNKEKTPLPKRPTIRRNYTPQDLKEYARLRYQREMEDTAEILAALDSGKIEEASEHKKYREPLEITHSHQIKIGLSWGGDEDGFILDYDENKELTSGVYYWADWGVYEEVRLKEKEAEEVERLFLCGDARAFIEK